MNFELLAGAFYLLAFAPFALGILRPKDQPKRFAGLINFLAPKKMDRPPWVAFLIWLTADVLVLLGMIASKTVNFQIVAAIVGATFILCISLWKRQSGVGLADKVSLVVSITGIVLWQTLDNPSMAIFFGCLAIFCAGLPMYVDAWKNPDEHNKLAWVLWTVSCVFQLMGQTDWSFRAAAQPVTFLFVELTMIFMIFVAPPMRWVFLRMFGEPLIPR